MLNNANITWLEQKVKLNPIKYYTVVYHYFTVYGAYLSPEAFKVYFILRSHIRNKDNSHDEVFPSIPVICSLAKLSDRLVKDVLKELEHFGWISITKNKQRNNTYSFTIPLLNNEIIQHYELSDSYGDYLSHELKYSPANKKERLEFYKNLRTCRKKHKFN